MQIPHSIWLPIITVSWFATFGPSRLVENAMPVACYPNSAPRIRSGPESFSFIKRSGQISSLVGLRGGNGNSSVWDRRPPPSFWSEVGVTGSVGAANYGSLGAVTCDWMASMIARTTEMLNDEKAWDVNKAAATGETVGVSMEDSSESASRSLQNRTAVDEDAEARRWRKTHRMSKGEYAQDMRSCLRWMQTL